MQDVFIGLGLGFGMFSMEMGCVDSTFGIFTLLLRVYVTLGRLL